ncbi:hypothetical protein CGRA01v4_00870 [Colletotrichum graminicola]|nr:hypothetical protein CGRA01v4_00870 [Colletotrichum graminicola]
MKSRDHYDSNGSSLGLVAGFWCNPCSGACMCIVL